MSSLVGSLAGALLLMLPAEAAKLQSWQFDRAQNQLSFTTDEPVQPRVQFLKNPARLVIELPNTSLERRRVRQNETGAIDEVEVRREDDELAQIIIELDNDYTIDPAQVIVRGTSSTGWTVQLPQPQPQSRSQRRASRDQPAVAVAVMPYVEAATLEAIELSGNQVILRSDRPLSDYSSGWDQATASYQITLPKTQLARGFTTPRPEPRGSLLSLRARQQETSVVLSLVPAPGLQFGALEASGQTLALNLTGAAQRRLGQVNRSPLPPLDQLPNVASKQIKVAIDPGHGGRDPGAVGIGGLRETDIVLPVGLKLAEILRTQGVEVVLTRQDDREIDLEPRVSTANRADVDLFISVHANAISLSRPDVNGIETYYYSTGAAKVLAEAIQESLLDATGSNDRGVRQARFYVLHHTQMPATLVELGFVTGAEDARRLSDPQYRDLLAQAVARGVLHYITQNF
ncbi:MAG: N-acetylmuramoyl-L-alanine amidase [Pegethrix bostrychoides GSE-TBD4-15B]|jgi:N-acetylmuramoyl-L-alanine amidase|uniref:N-acetylmuramoyl-L-alanine amidase n=1 Tax=Pegethrix bostrychoides GSE-TBD4-15B TaxID=2839662 RepID=A0A951PCM4_9CYAN|nr:N-acetylmuramoyl-L-alanine amidase [Pegethrix bostrychoides GSE-TBD4-15B]